MEGLQTPPRLQVPFKKSHKNTKNHIRARFSEGSQTPRLEVRVQEAPGPMMEEDNSFDKFKRASIDEDFFRSLSCSEANTNMKSHTLKHKESHTF